MLSKMLIAEPKRRIPIDDLLKHAFWQDVKVKHVKVKQTMPAIQEGSEH